SEYAPISPEEFENQPTGSDLVLDRSLILDCFPYMNPAVVAMVQARRCGWFSGQQLGMYLLEKARGHGVRVLRGRLTGVDMAGGRVQAVRVIPQKEPAERIISTGKFVNAAGPYLKSVGHLLGVDLPVFCEFHGKIAFVDHLGIVSRDAP